MIFDDDGFEYDPCWDCEFWLGECCCPAPEDLCPDLILS